METGARDHKIAIVVRTTCKERFSVVSTRFGHDRALSVACQHWYQCGKSWIIQRASRAKFTSPPWANPDRSRFAPGSVLPCTARQTAYMAFPETHPDRSRRTFSTIHWQPFRLPYHPTRLHELNLRSNHLTALPDEMGALVVLHRLDLAHNHLERRLSDHLGMLTRLTDLDLSSNRIGNIPPALGGLEVRGNDGKRLRGNNNLLGQVGSDIN